MSMRVLGIDPGETKSGWCEVFKGEPVSAGYCPNDDLIVSLPFQDQVVIEGVIPYSSGLTIPMIATIAWMGEFRREQRRTYPGGVSIITRNDIVYRIVGSHKGGDPAVRDVLIHRFGGKDKALGTAKDPGVLYKLRGTGSHKWAAFAAALAWLDGQKEKNGE